MTDQITVPRATWDAISAALQAVRPADSLSDSRLRLVLRELAAITAANAVSEHVPETNFGNISHPQATEPAEKEDPLQGAVDWLHQADGEFFAVATVQRTLRIGYNRAKRLADIARERAAAPEAKQ